MYHSSLNSVLVQAVLATANVVASTKNILFLLISFVMRTILLSSVSLLLSEPTSSNMFLDWLLDLGRHLSTQWIWYAGFYPALLSTAVFLQRFKFFTVCLVNYLCEVPPWWAPRESFLKFKTGLLENLFLTLFLTAEAWLVIHLSTVAETFLETLEFHGEFYETEFHNWIQDWAFTTVCQL